MLEWIVRWEAWVGLGMVLVIGEVFVGGGILVSLGVAAVVLGGWIWVGAGTSLPLAFDGWQTVLIAYGALALASAMVVRIAFGRRPRRPDVNDY